MISLLQIMPITLDSFFFFFAPYRMFALLSELVMPNKLFGQNNQQKNLIGIKIFPNQENGMKMPSKWSCTKTGDM